VVEHVSELSPKLREAIASAAATLELARKLLRLDRDVPIDADLEALRFGGLAGEAIRPIFAELGFTRLLEQLDSLGLGGQERVDVAASAAAAGQTSAGDFDYSCVNTSAGLDEFVGSLRCVTRLAVDTETTALHPMWAELVGISLAWRPGAAVYIPVKAPLGEPTLPLEEVRAKLGPLLGDGRVEKIGQNLKYDMIVLANAGMPLAGKMFDTMIAAHVLDSTRPSYALDSLAAEFLGHRSIPIADLLGRGRNKITMDAVPLEKITPYACEDADLALRLADVLAGRLAQESLADLFERLEMPLMPVLAEMERTGIIVDRSALGRMKLALSKRVDVLHDRIVGAAGRSFNPDSPKQLAEVLFEEMKLPVLKRTAGGPSTDMAVLEELAAVAELPGLVLDYRKLAKLLGTYVTALGACIHPRTGRVHTSFSQTSTATGRLASSDPNLQNIPIRSDEGREIRSAFRAAEGCLLLSADYSQVELRVLAHLCEDPTLIAAFAADQDIHRIVAAEVFAVPVGEVASQQRARAKTVNFGIIYGQTAYGLALTLRISRQEAGEFIQRYRRRFPRIEEFLQSCVAAAQADGYVETILRRRRRIAGLDARGPVRAQAERLAINSVVQGSAADIIKLAMIHIAERIRRENRPGRLLLQIHDELLLEAPGETIEAEREMVVSEMCSAASLRVPLKVDVGVGADWKAAK
jgi:DNA polymerase-1